MSCFCPETKGTSETPDVKVLTKNNLLQLQAEALNIPFRHNKITIYIQFTTSQIFLGAALKTNQSGLVAVSVLKPLKVPSLFPTTSLKKGRPRLTF